ncbi:hypothetical protein MASR2M15_11450 [Anaerolineales bacterium]
MFSKRLGSDELQKKSKPQSQNKTQDKIADSNTVIGRSNHLLLQTKMTVTSANDAYESEADRVASEVVQKINSPDLQREEDEEELQMKRVQRVEEDELQMKRIQRDNEEEELQMKRIQRVGQDHLNAFDVGPDIEAGIESSRGGGQSMPSNVQSQMESAFGADFGQVRIHSDSQSDQLSRSISAKAFTTGQDIFFRQDAYEPGSSGGKELLAHELTHVVQQNGASVQKKDDKDKA